MKHLLALLAFALPFGAFADEACNEVRERSKGRIECTRDDFGYALHYKDWLARRLTLASGYYDALIERLCRDGGVVRESWDPPFEDTQLRVTHCPQPK
jgi:hypothetical protein